MKIAIAGHPTYGGSGVVAAELGMALADRGHEVHFVSYQAPFRIDPLHPRVTFHEVEVTSYPLFRYPRTRWRCRPSSSESCVSAGSN